MPGPTARRSATTIVLTLFTVIVFISTIISPLAALGTVGTDQADYAPGSVVTISGDNSNGAGYLAGETVSVEVSGPNDYTASCAGVADAEGAWSCQVTLWASELAVGGYTYTATGQTSGVTETGAFTDAVHVTNAVPATYAYSGGCTALPASSFTVGDTVCVKTTVTTNGSGSADTFYLVWTRPIGSIAFADAHAAASTTYADTHAVTDSGSWTVRACDANDCNTTGGNKVYGSATFTVGDTSAPANVTIAIDGGADWTNSTTATLHIHGQDNVGVTGYFVTTGPTTSCLATAFSSYSSIASTLNYDNSSVPFTLTTGDGTKTVCVVFRDAAGNKTAGQDNIGLDTASPAAPVISSPADDSYTNSSTVTVSGTAEANSTVELFDGAISLGTTSADGAGTWSTTLSAVGDGQHTYTATATDAASNTSAVSNSVDVTVDTIAPAIVLVGRTPANAHGWNNGPVALAWSCADSGSGPVDASLNQTLNGEGANQSVTATCQDLAGNTASDTQSGINIDLTAPSASASADRLADHNGWYNHALTVTFAGSDGLSGIDSCSLPVTYNGPDTATASVAGGCTDKAGNFTAASLGFQFDKTAPNASLGVTTGTLGSNGWYTSDVTLTTTGTDSVSSPVTCTADQHQTNETTGALFTGFCTNDAGLTTAASPLTIKLDKTAPTNIAFEGGGLTDGTSYYFGFVPLGPTGCTADGAISGLASCAVAGYEAGLGSHAVIASAVDSAGNSGQVTLTYTVLAWQLRGFYAPVDMRTDATPGLWNTVKGGSTVPLKFEVFAGASELTDVGDVTSFTAATVSCTATAATEVPVEFTTTGGTSLRYDSTAGQFIQNWQTPKGAGKCYVVTMTTRDGSSLSAYFKTK